MRRGFFSTTGSIKDLNRQLAANPCVELCFYDAAAGKQIRISGTVEPQDDLALKKRIVEKFPFLKTRRREVRL